MCSMWAGQFFLPLCTMQVLNEKKKKERKEERKEKGDPLD